MARGVFIAGDAPATWQQARAIHLATGGVVSHTPPPGRTPPPPGRTPTADVDRLDGVPVTTPPRTIQDLARHDPPWHAVCALDAALRTGRLPAAQFERLRGHPGRQVRQAAAMATRAASARWRPGYAACS